MDVASQLEAIRSAVRAGSAGDIPGYNQFAYSQPTMEDALKTGNQLANTRNDIATGTTDPYGWGDTEETPFTFAELQAIQKAQAGIYDPAIEDAKAKHDGAVKKREAELEHKNRMEEIRLTNSFKNAGNGDPNDIFGGAKLTTGQKNEVADMLVLQKQIVGLTDLKAKYGGYVGAGPTTSWINRPLAALTGKIRDGAQDIRNNIGQIKGYIAKLRGGTSFTPNEQKLLDTYTPSIGDSDAVIDSKLRSLSQFVTDKLESTIMVAGGTYTPTSVEDLANENIVVEDNTGTEGKLLLMAPNGDLMDASALTPEEYNQAIRDGYIAQ